MIGGCMNKVYNTQKDIASGFSNFLKEIFPNIRKTQLKIIPYIIHGMIISESLVPNDIAKVLKDDFSLVQIKSIVKRIKRLLIIIRKNIMIKEFILYLTICILKISILFS